MLRGKKPSYILFNLHQLVGSFIQQRRYFSEPNTSLRHMDRSSLAFKLRIYIVEQFLSSQKISCSHEHSLLFKEIRYTTYIFHFFVVPLTSLFLQPKYNLKHLSRLSVVYKLKLTESFSWSSWSTGSDFHVSLPRVHSNDSVAHLVLYTALHFFDMSGVEREYFTKVSVKKEELHGV
jgi:hypothetical protein